MLRRDWQDARMNRPESAPQGRGCLFYGIIAALVLLVLTVVGLFLSYRFVKNSVNAMVQTYTQTNAAPIAVVDLPPERLEDIQSRIKRFREALDKQEGPGELSLSAEEINGLIAGDPNARELKNRLFVRIEEDRISGDVSIPLPDLGPLKLQGRYLNGQATFRVTLTNQNLKVYMDNVEVNGKPLPAVLQKELVKKNLADEMRQDPEMQAFLKKMETIRIQDDRLILRTKAGP